MNDDAREPFEIPKDMRSMAEASFEQARQSFEKFVVSAQAAAGSEGGAVTAGADGALGFGSGCNPLTIRITSWRSSSRRRSWGACPTRSGAGRYCW